MRQIKFRALDANGNWHYSHLDTVDFWINVGQTLLLRQETLCEFTGLTDKNGKEIWEGDIIKGLYYGSIYPEQKSEVIFGCGRFMDRYFRVNLVDHHQVCEVLGNIYENPSLLTQGEVG